MEIAIQNLLDMCTNGKGRIVCTSDLTEFQIADARKYGRIAVTGMSIGYVLLPWEFWCKKDLRRAKSAIENGAEYE